jgi:hypothetical protein
MPSRKLVKNIFVCAVIAGITYYMTAYGMPRIIARCQKIQKEQFDHTLKIIKVVDVVGKQFGRPCMYKITVCGDSAKHCQEYGWPKHFDMPPSPDYNIQITHPYCEMSIAEINRAVCGIDRAITKVIIDSPTEIKK